MLSFFVYRQGNGRKSKRVAGNKTRVTNIEITTKSIIEGKRKYDRFINHVVNKLGTRLKLLIAKILFYLRSYCQEETGFWLSLLPPPDGRA